MNFLDQLLRGGTPQRPAAYPREGNIEDDFALMADAGWFNAPQAGNQTVTQFDPMATDSRLGNAPQVEKEKNALNTLFQGAIFGDDLEKAARLAVTPEQQALLGVAYGQRMNRQAGVQSDLMGDYSRAQEVGLERQRMGEDRAMKAAEIRARIAKLEAEVKLKGKQTELAGKAKPRTGQPLQITDAAGNVRLFTPEGELIKDLGASGKPTATYEKGVAAKRQMGQDIDTAIRELTEASKDGGWIDQSTGSGAGALVDSAAGFFGKATDGAVASGKLKPVADLVLKMVPRFEGPQSDKDTQLYKDASADIANAATPNPIKKEAAKVILGLMKARKGQFIGANNAGTEVDAPAGDTGKEQRYQEYKKKMGF